MSTPDPRDRVRLADPGESSGPAAGPAEVALPRELILASAGSGKTFRISSRMLGLLAHGEPPDAILASTFTRNAAGEILARLLVRLAEAALDPAKAEELAGHVTIGPAEAGAQAEPAAILPAPDTAGTFRTGGAAAAHRTGSDGSDGSAGSLGGTGGAGSVGLAAGLDCDRCLELLAQLARRLHRLNVSTLDAFFLRTAQSFAHELGLPPGWGIADEPTSDRIRSEALQEVLGRGDPAAIAELVRLANRGRAARSVHDQLLRTLDRLLEIHHQVDPSVDDPWGIRLGPAAPEDVGLVRLAEVIEAVEPPPTATGKPNRAWARALAGAAAAIREADWDRFLGTGIGRKILAGETHYASVEIAEDVHTIFGEALDAARRALGRRITRQAAAMGRLVSLFDDAVARRRRETGAYRFDDVTWLLSGPAAPGARPDLDYRLDIGLRHLLLDEFQDTSLPQWTTLRPLVERLLEGGRRDRAVVIVADPKQSIYGWRGAKPELVRGVGERYELEREVLARSWRSSPVVLDAVNTVFGTIAGTGVFDEAERAAAGDWARDFTEHRAARDRPGHVRLLVGPDDPGPGEHRPRLLARTAELVRELHETAVGYGIGVLTRQNRAVARIIYELRGLGIEASEEGGNPLTDSGAVASVLALLHLADHPDDRVARYHVAHTPIAEAVGFRDPSDDAAARRLALRFRERLLRAGYGATLHELTVGLAGACDARDGRRLAQLVELAYQYDPRATLRPTDFVRLVETERIEDPIAAGVRVMTVHQAKGLEFDIVVLPELDTAIFRGGAPDALPYREDPMGPVTRVFPYVNLTARRLFPEIEQAYRQDRAAVLRDALSGLYVAMTRARHALHILVRPDPPAGPGEAKTAARIVREALAPARPARDGDVLYEAGDARWFEPVDRSRPASATEPAPIVVPLRLREPAPRRTRVLPRRSPSALEGGTSVDLAAFLRLDTAPSLERGSLVHAWCQELEWLDDGVDVGEGAVNGARDDGAADDARADSAVRDRDGHPRGDHARSDHAGGDHAEGGHAGRDHAGGGHAGGDHARDSRTRDDVAVQIDLFDEPASGDDAFDDLPPQIDLFDVRASSDVALDERAPGDRALDEPGLDDRSLDDRSLDDRSLADRPHDDTGLVHGAIAARVPDAARLRHIARRAAPTLPSEDVEALIERFRVWIGRPAIRAALRRERYPAGARVERELRFVHREDDAIVEGIIDRLVLWAKHGRVVGAEVLDYKTDAITAEDAGELERRLEHYRPQLAAYCAAVAALYQLKPERVQGTLVFLQPGVVWRA